MMNPLVQGERLSARLPPSGLHAPLLAFVTFPSTFHTLHSLTRESDTSFAVLSLLHAEAMQRADLTRRHHLAQASQASAFLLRCHQAAQQQCARPAFVARMRRPSPPVPIRVRPAATSVEADEEVRGHRKAPPAPEPQSRRGPRSAGGRTARAGDAARAAVSRAGAAATAGGAETRRGGAGAPRKDGAAPRATSAPAARCGATPCGPLPASPQRLQVTAADDTPVREPLSSPGSPGHSDVSRDEEDRLGVQWGNAPGEAPVWPDASEPEKSVCESARARGGRDRGRETFGRGIISWETFVFKGRWRRFSPAKFGGVGSAVKMMPMALHCGSIVFGQVFGTADSLRCCELMPLSVAN